MLRVLACHCPQTCEPIYSLSRMPACRTRSHYIAHRAMMATEIYKFAFAACLPGVAVRLRQSDKTKEVQDGSSVEI